MDDQQAVPPKSGPVWLKRGALVVAIALLAMSFINASWLAGSPTGRPKLIAHGGVHQIASADGSGPCAAAQIEAPTHAFLENSYPSLSKANQIGAGRVELDVSLTADGQLVAFADRPLDCLTDGKGTVSANSLEQLRQLDAAYGYSADGGQSFPLRGQGVGLITTVERYLQSAGSKPLLFHFTGSDPAQADRLLEAFKVVKRDPAKRGDAFYGAVEEGPIARIRAALPDAWTFSLESAQRCTSAYKLQGWLGLTPSACEKGTMIVPLDQQWAFAGWPNRAIKRLESVGGQVIVTGPGASADTPLPGLVLPEQLGEIPSTFNGFVWVDDIWTIGPALFPSVDRRSNDEILAAEEALERRRSR